MLSLGIAMALAVSPIIEGGGPTLPDNGRLAYAVIQQDPSGRSSSTRLEDIIVYGRPLTEATSDFVARVAAPTRDRGAATWDRTVCVGVGNLEAQAAQSVIDRIATVAQDLGLEPGRPDCQPSVFIVFASDADAFARGVVEAKGPRFRIGVSGADLGTAALQAFQSSDRPVRWWQASIPVNADTGVPTERLPGQTPFSAPRYARTPSDFGPNVLLGSASLLRSMVRDDLAQVIIIVDAAQVQGVAWGALSDYLAMIALAQVDPEVDPGPYDSILALFSLEGEAPAGLTDWDLAYLRGLYEAEQTASNDQARLTAVASRMAREVRERQRGSD